MGSPIIIFKKNAIDYGVSGIIAQASQSSDLAIYALNRSNSSAWMTTDSVDADNTTYEVETPDEFDVTDIGLVKQNFKASKSMRM